MWIIVKAARTELYSKILSKTLWEEPVYTVICAYNCKKNTLRIVIQ